MATIAATVAALEKYCGFPAARTRTVVRKLLDERLVTPGAPGVAVEISEADLALVLLGVASGATLATVADVVTELASTVPSGIDVDVMPEGIRPAKKIAFDALHDLVWAAAQGDMHAQARVSKINLEVVSSWPEIALHTPDGAVRFEPAGTLAGHWQGRKQRRATIIPGAALVDCVRELFGKE